MKVREDYTCPLEIMHDILKGKWKTIIIFQLRGGSVSLSKLERMITGINQKMLLQQLKELREFGLIQKISSDGYPLKVDYFLTDRGRQLLEAIYIMQNVGIEYMLEHDQADIIRQKGISVLGYPLKSK